jgi:uncharacterized protein YkwD
VPPRSPARHRAPRHGAEPPLSGRAPLPDAPLLDAPFPDAPFPDAPFPDAPFLDSPLLESPLPDSPPLNAPPRRARLSGRARYLLCGLLVLPLLAAAGLYLTRGSGPAPASASGQATAGPQAPAPCDPSAAGSASSCAGQPFHAAVASVPASLSPRPSAAKTKHRQPRSSPTASASASAGPASPTSGTSAASPPAGTSAGSAAAQVLALINQARSAAGLPALTITAGLNASASAHNSTMAGRCGLSHQCSGEPDLGTRETAAGVHWTACGENIGEGGPVASNTAAIARMAVSLTQDMLNEKPPDDGHRKNILSSSFTHIGIAVFRDSSGTVWLTQDFSN